MEINGDGILLGKNILLVDDDPIFCESAEEVLIKAGANVSIRRDGADALDFFEDGTCDLAVIDLMMPQIDGLRLISLLRRMPKTRHLPIVVVTSRYDLTAREIAQRNHVGMYLTKPVQWNQFALQIGRLIEDGGNEFISQTSTR